MWSNDWGSMHSNDLGFKPAERLRVHVGRTTEGSDRPNDWGLMRPNDWGLGAPERLGFNAVERFRVKSTRTINVN